MVDSARDVGANSALLANKSFVRNGRLVARNRSARLVGDVKGVFGRKLGLLLGRHGNVTS